MTIAPHRLAVIAAALVVVVTGGCSSSPNANGGSPAPAPTGIEQAISSLMSRVPASNGTDYNLVQQHPLAQQATDRIYNSAPPQSTQAPGFQSHAWSESLGEISPPWSTGPSYYLCAFTVPGVPATQDQGSVIYPWCAIASFNVPGKVWGIVQPVLATGFSCETLDQRLHEWSFSAMYFYSSGGQQADVGTPHCISGDVLSVNQGDLLVSVISYDGSSAITQFGINCGAQPTVEAANGAQLLQTCITNASIPASSISRLDTPAPLAGSDTTWESAFSSNNAFLLADVETYGINTNDPSQWPPSGAFNIYATGSNWNGLKPKSQPAGQQPANSGCVTSNGGSLCTFTWP